MNALQLNSFLHMVNVVDRITWVRHHALKALHAIQVTPTTPNACRPLHLMDNVVAPHLVVLRIALVAILVFLRIHIIPNAYKYQLQCHL